MVGDTASPSVLVAPHVWASGAASAGLNARLIGSRRRLWVITGLQPSVCMHTMKGSLELSRSAFLQMCQDGQPRPLEELCLHGVDPPRARNVRAHGDEGSLGVSRGLKSLTVINLEVSAQVLRENIASPELPTHELVVQICGFGLPKTMILAMMAGLRV